MPIDRSLIGTEIEPFSFPVERGKIREFATAILDERPEYLDDPNPPAPLTFTRTMNLWSNNFIDHVLGGGADVERVLQGGQEFEYLKPVLAGDTLTVHAKLAEVYTKEGQRGGLLTFMIYEYTFVNQDGDVAIKSRNMTIETSRPAVGAEAGAES